ncbi:MAG: FecCD family ABC transporter permease [Desulfitobacteriia bacterium]|jgi:iron complex transport system permease protein
MIFFKKQYRKHLIIINFFLLIIISIYSFTLGPADIPFSEALIIILAKIPILNKALDTAQYSAVNEAIIWSLRMPRVVLAAFVGGALAVAGGTYQAFFKNPLADPYIIGISSGAALGATIGFITTVNFLGLMKIPFFSFLGALITTLIVYNIARVGKKIIVATLLLAGVAFNSFLSSLMSFLMVMNTNKLDKIFFWLMGSFSNRTWQHVQITVPLILIGVLVLMLCAKELNALVFGDSTAMHLGIDLLRLRALLLGASSITAAGAVAVCGTIGFVGLIIPHIVRILVGPDHRILLPLSFLVGGIFMVVADTLSRTLFAPMEIPIGIITALFGGPFFIYLLKKKKSVTFSGGS